MKSLNLMNLTIVGAVLFIGLPLSAEDRSCSNAGVAGAWSYVETGNVYPAGAAVPFSAVASYTLDGSGNLSGSAVSSSGGTVSSVTLQGTGTVNSDCTSTLTVGVYSHGTFVRTVTFAIVYVNHGSEGLGLVTSLVLANGTSVPAVLTIDAKKVNTND
jgi:hypothetical protein